MSGCVFWQADCLRVLQVADGLQLYFDKSLQHALLYQEEQDQRKQDVSCSAALVMLARRLHCNLELRHRACYMLCDFITSALTCMYVG